MPRKTHVHLSDLAGLNRLATDATAEVTNLAEAVHKVIARSPGMRGTPIEERSSGIADLVYESIRNVTRLVALTTDNIIAQLGPGGDEKSSPEREAVLAVLNGVMGD